MRLTPEQEQDAAQQAVIAKGIRTAELLRDGCVLLAELAVESPDRHAELMGMLETFVDATRRARRN